MAIIQCLYTVIPLLATIASSTPLNTRKPSEAIRHDDFIYVDGVRLRDSKGLHYLTGLNYWSCMNLAADSSQGGQPERLLIELDQMQAKGVNHLRIMAG